jgi:RNA polymerase sigma-70 factor (ECF subfamily)
VVYLVYNAGADRGPDDPVADDLRAEAIRLARLLVALMPDEPEAAGLLALLLLTESRRGARYAADGTLVLLRDQDRGRWDAALIAEGHRIVRGCLRRDRPGPYQVQAAIGAVHADAASVASTDWRQVVALYDHLLELAPTPVVALNRAVAVAEVDGPRVALALVDDLDLDGYHPFHATRADLLRRLGRTAESAAAYRRAAATTPDPAARAHFLTRADPGS